jgi:hypothetical protein
MSRPDEADFTAWALEALQDPRYKGSDEAVARAIAVVVDRNRDELYFEIDQLREEIKRLKRATPN